jgi:menaquinone-dependent protoporphyrinogen IX oxidase
MITAIIFTSKHGTSEKVASKLAEKFSNSGDEVDLFNSYNFS